MQTGHQPWKEGEEAPHISRRRYIQWEGEEPSEPTYTIVLTAPSNQFVDIRILKPADQDAFNRLSEEKLKRNLRLDWAFGGQTTSSRVEDSSKKPTKCEWIHWVDNNVRYNEKAPMDAGIVYQHEEEGLSLEHGSMVNPATGKMTKYQEMWENIPMARVEGHSKWCVTARLDNPDLEAKGTIVRLAQYIHAVLRAGDTFAASIWMWEPESHSEANLENADAKLWSDVCGQETVSGRWKEVFSAGPYTIKCEAFMQPQSLEMGEELEADFGCFRIDGVWQWPGSLS